MHQIISTLGAFLLLMGSIPTAFGRMKFLSPPEFDGPRDVRQNTVWTVGSPLELRWTPGEEGKTLSVMLYQITPEKAATFDGKFDYTESDGAEYITRDQINATDFTWLVGTRRDLSVSPMFAIAIWQQGALITDSTINIFNISDARAPPPSSTQTSSTLKTTTTGTAMATAATETGSEGRTTRSGAGAGTGVPPTPATGTAGGIETGVWAGAENGGSGSSGSSSNSSSSGLSTSEAIGVGVGATAGVVLLIALGWFLGRRCARNKHNREKLALSDPSVSNEQEIRSEYGHGDGNSGYYLGPNGTYYYYSGTASHGPPTEMGVEKDPVEALPGADVQRKVELPASGW
ncbi:uncharacterized protein C8A04DRAFT_30195 [Dichotomopilus funicola]|uniref:Uncharacterized protein n=1 Tax=Dichotomopilus funicola TaxID=1934379 RepID=A0AAN6ZM24_9PEZI|nr:hypothetical protein C8A04DRAFT_30195 [Dichotomopilus funicola]